MERYLDRVLNGAPQVRAVPVVSVRCCLSDRDIPQGTSDDEMASAVVRLLGRRYGPGVPVVVTITRRSRTSIHLETGGAAAESERMVRELAAGFASL